MPVFCRESQGWEVVLEELIRSSVVEMREKYS
jgi:hypothetical protein